jgi:hypothetical protein
MRRAFRDAARDRPGSGLRSDRSFGTLHAHCCMAPIAALPFTRLALVVNQDDRHVEVRGDLP